MAEEEIKDAWYEFTGMPGLQFYIPNKKVRGSVMPTRTGNWRWSLRESGLVGWENTEAEAKAKVIEMLTGENPNDPNQGQNREG